jgi:hypothetical protein
VRGRLEPETAEAILAFWDTRGVLGGEAAQRRLAEVVCVLRDGDALAGVSSVYPADVEMIGGRRFWIYRNLLDPEVGDQFVPLVAATFDALAAEFDGTPGSPLGLCLLIGDPELRQRDRSVIWARPPMAFAGYLPDDRQVRIAYFPKARIT